MVRRAFIIVIALCNALLLYGIFDFVAARAALVQALPGYALDSENADLAVVEFLDYSCAHCREVEPVIMEAIRKDGKVRYIPRPLPSVFEGPAYAEMAYAAGLQGKFLEMHRVLMENKEPLTDATRASLAAKAGIDEKRMVTDMQSQSVQDSIRQNRRLNAYFYDESLPVFVIGNKIQYAPGREIPTVEQFTRMFAQARGRS